MQSKSSRSYLSVGIAAIGASAISVASVMAPPADIEVPAHQATSTAGLSQEMVELLAAIQRTTPKVDTRPAPTGSSPTSGSDTPAPEALGQPPIPLLDATAPPVETLPAPTGSTPVAATPGSDAAASEVLALPSISLLVGLADAIDNTYNAVEPALRFLVEAFENGLTAIGVPVFLAAQGTIFYTFSEAVVKSVLFNTTDWLRGEDGFFSNLEDLGTDLLIAGVWLVADELTAFDFPIPIDLPRPPINQSVASASSPVAAEGLVDSVSAQGVATDDAGSGDLADETDTDSPATVDPGSPEGTDSPAPVQESLNPATEIVTETARSDDDEAADDDRADDTDQSINSSARNDDDSGSAQEADTAGSDEKRPSAESDGNKSKEPGGDSA